MQRAQSDDWLENRVIVYALGGSQWVERLERKLSEGDLDQIPKSGEIFGVLDGTEDDYDQQLFDALAEARLARWARGLGYRYIEKLRRGRTGTPDFRMTKEGEVALAEAKRFRTRDWLVDYVDDRLRGLAFESKALNEFGLCLRVGPAYARERGNLVGAQRLLLERQYRNRARSELTKKTFYSLVQDIARDRQAAVSILDGLFTIERDPQCGAVNVETTAWISWGAAVDLMLSKMGGELMNKLGQLQDFIAASGQQASRAVVFFSGTDEWHPEWDAVWDALGASESESDWPWESVVAIRHTASTVISIPFDLIVARGAPVNYGPFPWKPGEVN